MVLHNIHGYKGIRQWPINWCTSSMMMHNISGDYNNWLKHLETQQMNQNSIKVPKVVEPTNKKTLL